MSANFPDDPRAFNGCLPAACNFRPRAVFFWGRSWNKLALLTKIQGVINVSQRKILAIIVAPVLSLALLAGSPPAMARGCLKGAAVGAVAGHVAGHHAVLGAVAGCAVGHHMAKKQQRQQQQLQQQQSQPQPLPPQKPAPTAAPDAGASTQT